MQLTHASRRLLLRKGGALVEAPSLYPHLTGRENLRVTQELILAAPSDFDRVLQIVHLKQDADRLVSGYSQSMRQPLGSPTRARVPPRPTSACDAVDWSSAGT